MFCYWRPQKIIHEQKYKFHYYYYPVGSLNTGKTRIVLAFSLYADANVPYKDNF